MLSVRGLVGLAVKLAESNGWIQNEPVTVIRQSTLAAVPLPVSLVESLDATGGVDDGHRPGVEGVGVIRHLKEYVWILLAIVPGGAPLGGDCRTADPALSAGRVLEDNRTIVGVDPLFH